MARTGFGALRCREIAHRRVTLFFSSRKFLSLWQTKETAPQTTLSSKMKAVFTTLTIRAPSAPPTSPECRNRLSGRRATRAGPWTTEPTIAIPGVEGAEGAGRVAAGAMAATFSGRGASLMGSGRSGGRLPTRTANTTVPNVKGRPFWAWWRGFSSCILRDTGF